MIIAGAGRAGGEMHVNACMQIEGLDIIALCDPNLDKAGSIAGQKRVPYHYSSLDDALNAHSTDIVSICTPPSSHFDLCRLALGHGCHILMEKPIFQTLDEAHEIRRIISRTEQKFSAVHNQKYLSGVQQALQLVRRGFIGEVLHVHAARMIHGNKDRLVDPNSWCNDLPGGRWEELIAHPIYKAYQFMGPLKFVHLEMKKVRNRWPWLPADEIEIILEGGSGYVNITLSANADNYNHMLVYGSERILFINDHSATDVLSGMRPADAAPSLREKLGSRLFGRHNQAKPYALDPHAELIKDFVSYIKGTCAAPPVDWQEAMNVFELGLQIGREIALRKSNKFL